MSTPTILHRSLIALSALIGASACGGGQQSQPPPAAATPAPQTETAQAQPAEAPAPTPAPVAQLQDNRIVISEKVRFEENSDALHSDSDHILDEVVQVLHSHPEVTHLRVEGHTDNLGAAEHNQHLSEGRAAAVVQYLRDHGVADSVQLDSQGFGSTQPICNEDTDECRAQNRRVDFVVVDGSGGEASSGDAAGGN